MWLSLCHCCKESHLSGSSICEHPLTVGFGTVTRCDLEQPLPTLDHHWKVAVFHTAHTCQHHPRSKRVPDFQRQGSVLDTIALEGIVVYIQYLGS